MTQHADQPNEPHGDEQPRDPAADAPAQAWTPPDAPAAESAPPAPPTGYGSQDPYGAGYGAPTTEYPGYYAGGYTTGYAGGYGGGHPGTSAPEGGYPQTGAGWFGHPGDQSATSPYAPYAAPADAGSTGSAYPPFGPQPAAPVTTSGRAGGAGPRRTVLVAAAVAAVVGAGVGAGTVAVVGDHTTTVSSGLQYSTQTAPAAKVDGTVGAAADKIRPSVVTIEVAASSERDTGSGVVIRPDGYILTNNHVVSNSGQGTTTVVTLADGRRASATVVGRDPSDDLAVVKVPLTGLTAATFGSSASLAVGQTVVAVGAPLGLSDTVTAGIVSSTARPVSTGDSTSTATFNAVQTDAAINPGNSGGPLVDLTGNVVGINAAIATDSSQGGLQVPGQSSQSGNIGIGFAIPADEARRIAGELIATGKATHAVMGVSVRDASAGAAATDPVGARVQAVTAGGPAAKAGLRVGDVITQVDTQRIDGADAVVAAIRSRAPGQTVRITAQRGNQTTTVTVRLDSATD